MVRSIIHTLGSRLVIAVFNLLLLFITTKLMGAENKGEISLLVLNLSIATIISGLFGGPSLVYLVPRFPMKNILAINYTWSIISSLLVTSLLVFDFLPSSISTSKFFFMSLMECTIATHMMALLGKEKVSQHNYLQIIKITVVLSLLVYYQYSGLELNYTSFEMAYAFGLASTFLISILALLPKGQNDRSTSGSILETLRSCLKYGATVQIGNIAQLLNYRLSFYLLELLILPPQLALIRIGIYSATLQVSEALWQFARSVSIVQYSAISNMEDKATGLRISMQLARLNGSVTMLGIILLSILPESLYATIFGQEFGEIKTHFLILTPGILALSYSNAFSHFFAGIGLHRINTESSVLGLILTVLVGIPSITYMGTEGAATTASLVYFAQTIYQFIRLRQKFGTAIWELIPDREDWDQLVQLLRNFTKTK